MAVPDHNIMRTASPRARHLNIAAHLGKARLFMNAMHFAPVPHDTDPMAVVLTACPFTEPGTPDLANELRRTVERVFRADGDRICHLVTEKRSRGSSAPGPSIFDGSTKPSASTTFTSGWRLRPRENCLR